MNNFDKTELISTLITKVLDIEKSALDKIHYPGKSKVIADIIKTFEEEYSKYENN